MYFYGTELKSFEEIEFSYKDTPNIKLIDAIYITSAIPSEISNKLGLNLIVLFL